MEKIKKLIGSMQTRIMRHQQENGFETIYDFLNEDLLELWQQIENLSTSNISDILKIEEHRAAGDGDRCFYDIFHKEWFKVDDNQNIMPVDRDFLIKFDNGQVTKYSEKDWPFIIVTHWAEL